MKTSLHFFTVCRNITLLFFLFSLTMCNNAKENWQKAKMANSIQAYENFIKDFPKSKYSDSSNLKLQELYFNNLKYSDSLSSYQSFKGKYPESKYIDSVNLLLEKLYFKRANDTNTISSYKNFIKLFPKGKYVDTINYKLDHIPYYYGIKFLSCESTDCQVEFEISVFHSDNFKPNIYAELTPIDKYATIPLEIINSKLTKRININNTTYYFKVKRGSNIKYGDKILTFTPGDGRHFYCFGPDWQLSLYQNLSNNKKPAERERKFILTFNIPFPSAERVER